MKNIIKKAISIVCAAFLSVCTLAIATPKTASANTSEPTPIDMYLIAGQSNAAGYSSKGFKNLTETFENVGYGGEVQRYFRSTTTPSSSCYLEYEDFIWGVRSGLGASGGYVGPEYGIAKVINGQYENRADGRKAFIFKTAAGGTSLRDIDGDIGTTTGNWGNWYPRSLWPAGYKPNTATNQVTNDATGYLYELFVENFEIVYNELKDNGYAPVVKGLAWMQGEQDLDFPTQYKELLKTFIQDIRADIAKITGDNAVNSMPFVIGNIAPTFSVYNNPLVPTFNQMQANLAQEMDAGVDTISADGLVIVNQDGTYNGTDKYHFNCADAEILGTRFGEKLLQLNGKKIASVGKLFHGNISYSFGDDGKLTVTAIPENGERRYRLSKLFVNDVDVTENMNGNVYVIDAPEDRTHLFAEFVEVAKCNVTYTMDKKQVGLVAGNVQVYENDDLTFELDTKDGYKIVKVTINGTEISAVDNVYTYEKVTTDVEVNVETQKIATGNENNQENNENNNVQTSESGCGSVISGTAIGLVGLLGVCLMQRKKNQ